VNGKIGHVIYIRESESILQSGDGTRTTGEREKLIPFRRTSEREREKMCEENKGAEMGVVFNHY
jgi:hypothetical protein